MVKILLIGSGVVYLLMAVRLCTAWLEFYKEDTNLKDYEKFPSFIVLVIATIFWPIVVPFAYLELLSKTKKTQDFL